MPDPQTEGVHAYSGDPMQTALLNENQFDAAQGQQPSHATHAAADHFGGHTLNQTPVADLNEAQLAGNAPSDDQHKGNSVLDKLEKKIHDVLH